MNEVSRRFVVNWKPTTMHRSHHSFIHSGLSWNQAPCCLASLSRFPSYVNIRETHGTFSPYLSFCQIRHFRQLRHCTMGTSFKASIFCEPFGDLLPDSPLLASFCHLDQIRIRISIKIAFLPSSCNVNIRLTNAILSNFPF